MTRFLLLLFISISFVACKKDDSGDQTNCGPTTEDKLLTTWTLIEAFNPWTQQDESATAGVYKELEFQAGGTLIMRDPDNGDSDNETWELEPNGQANVLQVAGGSYWYTLSCDSLILDSTPVDGPRYTYLRQ